jgi:predicted oxidoreductase
MQSIQLGTSSLQSSRLAYGCWRVAGTWEPAQVTAESRAAGKRAIIAAYETGYTLFDNSDIYCRGEAELILGDALREVSGMRQRVLIATKGGIRASGDPASDAPARYDFSAEHLLAACDASLRRLKLETIDLYMLHRPDLLCDPQEVGKAFAHLQRQGKVRFFGVSNFRPSLLSALQKSCPMPLVVHQVEISLVKLDAFTDGMLDQCLSERITPMAWSPLAGGLIGGGASRLLPSQEAYRPEKFLPVLEQVARGHGVSRTVAALAWLLRHPSGIVPVIGTIDPVRIREAAAAEECELTREEWYHLLLAARGEPLP